VSGGTTPRAFLAALSLRLMAWDRITVTLVDERWVPEDHARSNARMVRESLLQGRAAGARFVSLYAPQPTPEAALAEVSARVAALPLPFAAVVFGMGVDGHTASFFGDGRQLAAAVDPDADVLVVPMHSATVAEPRMTLTLKALLQTRSLYLHIEGTDKRAALARALEPGPIEEAPVRAVLTQRQVPIKVFWCPSAAEVG
jgi:6-phosphogluconolactonase